MVAYLKRFQCFTNLWKNPIASRFQIVHIVNLDPWQPLGWNGEKRMRGAELVNSIRHPVVPFMATNFSIGDSEEPFGSLAAQADHADILAVGRCGVEILAQAHDATVFGQDNFHLFLAELRTPIGEDTIGMGRREKPLKKGRVKQNVGIKNQAAWATELARQPGRIEAVGFAIAFVVEIDKRLAQSLADLVAAVTGDQCNLADARSAKTSDLMLDNRAAANCEQSLGTIVR